MVVVFKEAEVLTKVLISHPNRSRIDRVNQVLPMNKRRLRNSEKTTNTLF